jgi:hypothetical protein
MPRKRSSAPVPYSITIDRGRQDHVDHDWKAALLDDLGDDHTVIRMWC